MEIHDYDRTDPQPQRVTVRRREAQPESPQQRAQPRSGHRHQPQPPRSSGGFLESVTRGAMTLVGVAAAVAIGLVVLLVAVGGMFISAVTGGIMLLLGGRGPRGGGRGMTRRGPWM